MYIEVNNKPLNIYSISYFYKDEKDSKYRIVYKTSMGILEVEEFNTSTDRDNKYNELKSIPIPGGGEATLQDKEVTITQNGTQTILADTGYDGLSSVEVTTAIPQPSGTINITDNGTYNVTNYASASVAVSASPPTMHNISEFNNQLQSLETTYHSQFTNSVTSRQVKDNNPVTLYAPENATQKYLIVRGTSSQFGMTTTCVFWYPPYTTYLKVVPHSAYPNDVTFIYPVYETVTTNKTADNIYKTAYQFDEEQYKKDLSYTPNNSTYDSYTATIEDAISALESSATKWKATSIDTNNSICFGKWDTLTYISNIPIIDSTNSLFTGTATFYRISADETITLVS